MKTRLLVSLMVIAMAAAMIGGATMAWFTDSDEAGPVTMTAGTLLIDIDNFDLVTTDVNLDILNPGDEFEYEFDVVNVGTKNLIFTGLLCYKDTLGNSYVEFPDGKDYGTDPLSEVLDVEISLVGSTADFGYGNTGIFYQGKLADYDNTNDPVGGYPVGLEAFTNPPGPIVFGEAGLTPEGGNQESLSYKVKFSLPTTAGNEYQGSKLEAAFVVMAKQIHADAEYGAFVCPLTPEV